MKNDKDWFSARKRRHKAREEKEFTRRRSRKQRRRGQSGREPSSSSRLHYLAAPVIFSLILNPDENIGFLNRLEALGESHKVYVKFDKTQTITPDAAVALVATMTKLPGGNVRGNVPNSAECKAILMQSGFFEYVEHRLDIEASGYGRIQRRDSKQVEGILAKELIDLETKAIFGNPRPSEASYRVLVEAMQNTSDHAHPDAQSDHAPTFPQDKETWWAMVYADVKRQKVCFAFIDVGVGIFRSDKIKTWRLLLSQLGQDSDSELLKKLLNGQLKPKRRSRTKQRHRGKGLPAMKKLSVDRQIEKFTVISNGVYAEVESESYRELPNAFSGTLLYWEV